MRIGPFCVIFLSMKEAQEILVSEIIRAGGEAALAHLSPEDRLIWDEQAMVLGYLRQSGNLANACTDAGIPASVEEGWYVDDKLDWVQRRTSAIASLGWNIVGTYYQKIMAGDSVSPTIVREMMKSYLPEHFDPKHAAAQEGEQLVEQFRQMKAAKRAEVEAQAAVPEPAEDGEDPPEEELPSNVIDILKAAKGR